MDISSIGGFHQIYQAPAGNSPTDWRTEVNELIDALKNHQITLPEAQAQIAAILGDKSLNSQERAWIQAASNNLDQNPPAVYLAIAKLEEALAD